MSIKSNAIIIRDETAVGANTANRVGGNLVDIADDLISKQSAIDLNTSKAGITSTQSSNINSNNAKVSYTDAVAVSANTSKVGYTEALVSANASVYANTLKDTYPSADATKLGGIEIGADVNTVNSSITGEPTGSDIILNIVSLTQAEYDAGTKIATTFYIIN
jgi:hypothetical protein